MEVQTDHGLLVVSLDNCITSDPSCDLHKTNSCVYPTPMSSGPCSHGASVVQLAAPIQHQHLTQLQPIQYPQAVNYDPNNQLQQGNMVPNHTLYQPMSVSTGPIHHYNTPNTTLHNPYLSTNPAPLLTPSPSYPPAPIMEDLTVTDHSDMSMTQIEGLTEPTYPAEGFDYFMEIQNYLMTEQYPPNISENYRKCLKKRAQNYLIIDGKLYHNRKQPKEVIMRKDEQEDMLSDLHVVRGSGIHLGVKKMFNKLHMKYFWRGMYTDVVSFVKKCDKCSDQLDLVQCHQEVDHERLGQSEESDNAEDPEPLSPNSLTSGRDRRHQDCKAQVWRKVEVQMHGPFKRTCNRNEFLLTMADPDSKWCCARAVPASGHPSQLADFVFHLFCNYGFARCSLVGCSKDLCDAVSSEYISRVTALGEVFSSAHLGTLESHQLECRWVEPLVQRLVQDYPLKWDEQLDHFLFQYRIGELKELIPPGTESPFSQMFCHNPLGFAAPEEDKENIDGNHPAYRLRRRKSYNSIMQCRHCDNVFTSKISLRIHQRKHYGEAGHRKHMARRKRFMRARNDVNSLSRQPNVCPPDTWRDSTVSAVKALLVATKEERRRRGKYHKYTVELQEQMATYAIKHGNPQAVRYFSERLGTMVSESTIRNLVKIHNAFSPSVKEQIGRFAVEHGVESAAKTFSEWLKRDISQSLVRKFQTIYLNKRQENFKEKESHLKFNLAKRKILSYKQYSDASFKGKRYTDKMKIEIGEYACSHSVPETAKYFTEKLQMLVKERTVKRFHKMYTESCQGQSGQHETTQEIDQTNDVNQGTTHVNLYNTFHQVQATPVTLYQLNQSAGENGTICYQTAASISSQNNSTFNYHPIQNYTLPLAPAPPSYPMALIKSAEKAGSGVTNISFPQDSQASQTCIIPQHSLIVAQDRSNPLLSHFMATSQPLQQTILTIIPGRESQKPEETQDTIDRHDQLQASFNTQESYQEAIPVVTEMVTGQDKQEEVLTNLSSKTSKSSEIEQTLKKSPSKKSPKKKSVTTKKRGSYTAYSPEIRAEIGKYAAEHGSIKACQHFAVILGHDVPESTVRGLKEKYLMKKKHCQVTSLGYSQRGRPLRLGKYDELVQDCIKELVRSGEKVSSFLAITTAKEILNKYEPALLEENGGNLKLNITWAKSFLKRIGVHNNS